jgi:hypothetical protein
MSENAKEIFTRIINKHDLEVNWLASPDFIPYQGEIIIYDSEFGPDGNILALPEGRTTAYSFERLKLGDGTTPIGELPFIDETILLDSSQVLHNSLALSNILETYILDIDYDTLLAFDTSEIVVSADTTRTSVLGQAILGQMVLA